MRITQQAGTAGRVRRVAAAAVSLVAATSLAAGCGGDDDALDTPAASSPTPSASPSANPKSTLLAAVPDEEDPAFRFSGSDPTGVVTGVVDPAGKGMDLTITEKDEKLDFTMKMSFRLIEQRSWMKVSFDGAEQLSSLLKLPTKWMELDHAKLTDPASVPYYEGADPGNTGAILGATGDTVTDQGGGTYTGTVDLTHGEHVRQAMADAVDVDALGEAAKAVPFTAVVGADGNLASLTLEIPAAGKRKATKYVVKYFDFGKAPKVTEPTGSQAQKAPASAYELLNG
ncbi:hypothetical protein M8I35_18210 [Micromonospora sp. MSM11]|nr:hypothetical protein [Micromonospora sp. MSM11]MCL7459115.1 hypothetical protein [Micromonospora sp. MSM11]